MRQTIIHCNLTAHILCNASLTLLCRGRSENSDQFASIDIFRRLKCAFRLSFLTKMQPRLSTTSCSKPFFTRKQKSCKINRLFEVCRSPGRCLIDHDLDRGLAPLEVHFFSLRMLFYFCHDAHNRIKIPFVFLVWPKWFKIAYFRSGHSDRPRHTSVSTG